MKESVSQGLKPNLGRGLMSGLKPGPISGTKATADSPRELQKEKQELGSLRSYFPTHDDGTVMNGAPLWLLWCGRRTGECKY